MRKILPLLLLVLGLVTLGVAVAQGVGGFVGSLQSVGQPWVAPQASTQDLTAGAYVVYEQSATRTLGAEDVTVTGPSGAVAVNSTISSTLTLGDVTYVGIAGFTAPQDGTYTIEVAAATVSNWCSGLPWAKPSAVRSCGSASPRWVACWRWPEGCGWWSRWS